MKRESIDFLLSCSDISLGDFELSRLNRVSNLRKQLRAIEDELLREEAEAMLARWLIENRGALVAIGRAGALQESFNFRESPQKEPRAEIARRVA